MKNQDFKLVKTAFAIAAIGTALVAIAASTEYFMVLKQPAELSDSQSIAKRLILIMFLLTISFELALFLLNRFMMSQASLIQQQKEDLKRYSRELEQLVTDQYGRIQKMIGQVHVITKNIPVVMWSIDASGKVLFSEGSGLNGVGLKPGAIIGNDFHDVLSDSPDAVRYLDEALKGKRNTATVKIANGWFTCRFAPLKDDEASTDGATMIAIDVSGEMGMTREASPLQLHCRNIAEHVPIGVVIASSEKIEFINQIASRAIGVSQAKELIGKGLDIVLDKDTVNSIRLHMKGNEAVPNQEVTFTLQNMSQVKFSAMIYTAVGEGYREAMLVLGNPTSTGVKRSSKKIASK